MTFSILGRDADGAIGMAVTSSSPCVAARCLHLRSGVGAVSSQNITDPRFGPFLLDALQSGQDAQQALASLAGQDSTLAYRQVSILPKSGAPVVHSGDRTLGIHHTATAPDAVAAGNLLASPNVVDAVLTAFTTTHGLLERRLMAALHAGLEAGGEAGDIHSAGLAVTRDSGWAETDLRVDWSDQPLTDLDNLLAVWLPQREDYVTRGIHPDTAPAYGVPGDE